MSDLDQHQIVPYERLENAVAQGVPTRILKRQIKILRKESRRQHYISSLGLGTDVVKVVLQGLKPEDLNKISRIRVRPKKFGFLGLSSKRLDILIDREYSVDSKGTYEILD